MLIHEYFKDSEVGCRCGCGLLPTLEAIERLYALRLMYRKPIIVNSGSRCNNHNMRVNGAVNSPHLRGNAFDLRVNDPVTFKELEYLSTLAGFKRIARGANFLHVDIEEREPVSWKY